MRLPPLRGLALGALFAVAACSRPSTPSADGGVPEAAPIGPPARAVVDAGAGAPFVPLRGAYALTGDGRRLYAAADTGETHGLYFAPTSGGEPEAFATLAHHAITRLQADGRACWYFDPRDGGGDLVFWAGQGERRSVADRLANTSLTFDRDHVYFSSDEKPPTLKRVPLQVPPVPGAHTSPEPLAPLPPGASELAVCGDRVFFAVPGPRPGSSVIHGLSLATKKSAAVATIENGTESARVLNLVCDAKHLYLLREQDLGAHPPDGALWRRPLERGTFELVAERLAFSDAIALDETTIYVTTFDALVAIDKVTKASRRLFERPGLSAFGHLARAIHVDATYVYWASEQGLHRVPKK